VTLQNKRTVIIANCFHVFRHFDKAILKILIYLIFTETFLTGSVANANGISLGTYFLVYTSNELAIAAIDSLVTKITPATGAISYSTTCKISILDDHAFFFSEGVLGIVSANNEDDSYVSKIAKIEYNRRSNPVQKIKLPVDFGRLADDWSKTIIQWLQAHYASMKQQINDRPEGRITVGYFVGEDSLGNIATIEAKIIKEQAMTIPIFDAKISLLPPHTFKVIGHTDIFNGFANAFQADHSPQNRPNILAAKIKMAVEAVRDKGNDPYVGGDIATVILERGHKWRWFHRPDFCPEN